MNQMVEAIVASGVSWKEVRPSLAQEFNDDHVKEIIIKVCQRQNSLSFFQDYARHEKVIPMGLVAALLRVFKNKSMSLLSDSILHKVENLSGHDFLLLKTALNVGCSHQILKKLVGKMDFSMDGGAFIKSLIFQQNDTLIEIIQEYGSVPEMEWKISELSACWSALDATKKQFIFSGVKLQKGDTCDPFVNHLFSRGEIYYGLRLLEKGLCGGNMKEANPLNWLCSLSELGVKWKDVQFLVSQLDPQEILKEGVSWSLLNYKEALGWLAEADQEKKFIFSLLAGAHLSMVSGASPASFILQGWKYLTQEQKHLIAHRPETYEVLSMEDAESVSAIEKMSDWFKSDKLKCLIVEIMNQEAAGEDMDADRGAYKKSGFLMSFLPVEETSKVLFDHFLDHPSAPRWNAAYRAKQLKERFEIMWEENGEPVSPIKRPRL